MRFYDFAPEEIAPKGNSDLDLDPKLAWALEHREAFPSTCSAPRARCSCACPGFGTKTVDRILRTRPHRTLRYDDLLRMGASHDEGAALHHPLDWNPGATLDSESLRARFAPRPEQCRCSNGSEQEDVGGGHDSPGLEVGDHHRRRAALAVHVEPQRRVRVAEHETVVAVLRQIVRTRHELRGRQRDRRRGYSRQTAAEAPTC
jgi:hypothetical protein